MTAVRRHERVNDIPLGPLERPTLQWLAAHMPARVTPDACTAVGVIGALVVALGYALSRWGDARRVGVGQVRLSRAILARGGCVLNGL